MLKQVADHTVAFVYAVGAVDHPSASTPSVPRRRPSQISLRVSFGWTQRPQTQALPSWYAYPMDSGSDQSVRYIRSDEDL